MQQICVVNGCVGYEPRGSGFDSCQPHQKNKKQINGLAPKGLARFSLCGAELLISPSLVPVRCPFVAIYGFAGDVSSPARSDDSAMPNNGMRVSRASPRSQSTGAPWRTTAPIRSAKRSACSRRANGRVVGMSLSVGHSTGVFQTLEDDGGGDHPSAAGADAARRASLDRRRPLPPDMKKALSRQRLRAFLLMLLLTERLLVETRRIELLTSALRTRRSPS